VATLAGTEYDTGLDLIKLDEIAKYFDPIRAEYINSGLLDTAVLKVDVNALLYQVPGGMLSNLVSQLKQAGKSDKLLEVLEEVPRVREDSGYPPLVTPTSQIVGTQAAFNIIMGERYKNVTKEFRGVVKGEYGKTPVAIKPEFIKQIIGDEKPITNRPADDIKPELDILREKVKPYYEQEEDILTYALFEQVAIKFFEHRKAVKYNIDADNADKENKVHPV
jgi:oxaloacetate decarboxylase alpha subunit